MVDLPAPISISPLASPPTVFRAWAGQYGVTHGFTTQLPNSPNGRLEFQNTPQQDAYRHSLVMGAHYLNLVQSPTGEPLSKDEIDFVISRTPNEHGLVMGYLNEEFASNPLNHHLQDYWNNYEGILLAKAAVHTYSGVISNDQWADFVAKALINNPGRFILSLNDPRLSPSKYDVNRLPPEIGAPELIKKLFSKFYSIDRCFLSGTMIDMWPAEAGLRPDAEGLYDEEEVRAKVWQKPIEEVTVKDWVLSFDQDGNLKPGRVKQTFENEAKIILDFHGTFVTPAHVYYCAGGTYEGKFVPLIDILRDDGVVEHADGSLIRASTGCEVGSEDDKLFWAFLLYEDENGMECVREKRQLRLGARWMMPNGKHFSMREYMEGCGIELVESGELEGYVRFKKTGLTTVFAWTLSDTLPSPEDFVLRRSQTTLEDIYRASEWESVHPQMPAPVIMDSGPVQPLSVQQFDDMPRNNPIGFQNNSPSSELKLNRKARKAEAARQRKTKKARQKADKAMGTLH